MVLPGFVILGFILSHVSFSQIGMELKHCNLWLFLLAVLLFFPMIYGKAMRWGIVLHALHIRLSTMKLLPLCFVGFFLGVATPGQTGDFIRVWHLKKGGYSLKDSLFSILADRSIDFILFNVFAIFGLFYYIRTLNTNHVLALFVLLFAIILVSVFTWLILLKRNEFFSHPLTVKFLSLFMKTEKINQLADFEKFTHTPIFWLKLLIVSVCEKVFLFLRAYLLALSLGIHINFFVFIGTMALVTLVQLIPITIEGIGLREAALVYFFSHLGYSKELAISFSILILLTRIINTLPGFFVWIKNPVGDILKIQTEIKKESIND